MQSFPKPRIDGPDGKKDLGKGYDRNKTIRDNKNETLDSGNRDAY